jgi:hypothetical protein
MQNLSEDEARIQQDYGNDVAECYNHHTPRLVRRRIVVSDDGSPPPPEKKRKITKKPRLSAPQASPSEPTGDPSFVARPAMVKIAHNRLIRGARGRPPGIRAVEAALEDNFDHHLQSTTQVGEGNSSEQVVENLLSSENANIAIFTTSIASAIGTSVDAGTSSDIPPMTPPGASNSVSYNSTNPSTQNWPHLSAYPVSRPLTGPFSDAQPWVIPAEYLRGPDQIRHIIHETFDHRYRGLCKRIEQIEDENVGLRRKLQEQKCEADSLVDELRSKLDRQLAAHDRLVDEHHGLVEEVSQLRLSVNTKPSLEVLREMIQGVLSAEWATQRQGIPIPLSGKGGILPSNNMPDLPTVCCPAF